MFLALVIHPRETPASPLLNTHPLAVPGGVSQHRHVVALMTAHKLYGSVSRHTASALPGIVLPSRHRFLVWLVLAVLPARNAQAHGLDTRGCFQAGVKRL